MKNKAKVALTFLLLAVPVAARAQYSFTTNADNTINIASYTGPGGAVSLPTNINGLTVTTIGANAFNGKSSVTGVTIPITITNIGNTAFEFCSGLASVTLGVHITSIGTNAFFDCGNLINITLPGSVTNLGDTVFGSCAKLTNIAVDASNPAFTSSNGVLFDKTTTTLIQFPGGLGGGYTITSNVISVAYSAFLGSLALTSVSVPSSVTNLGTSAFALCLSLTNIAVDGSNPVYSSSAGALFDKTQATLLQCPGGFNGTYSFPGSVNTIGFAAFAGCGLLSAVNLPGSITSIPGSAFYYCTNLASITIPSNVMSVEDHAFQQCSRLSAVTFGSGVTSIGSGAFTLCTNLKRLDFPASLTSIGSGAFTFCSRLTNVTFAGNVTNIASFAFSSCGSLTSVYFPGNAPSLGVSPFLGAPATLYYLPGATGWGSSLGVTAVVWDPQSQFPRINAGQFQFDITGPSNSAVVIVASADISSSAWVPVATNALSTSGTSTFTDPQSAGYSQRFYRFRSP